MRELKNIYSNLNAYPSPKKLRQDLSNDITVLGVGSARLVIEDPKNSNYVLKLGVGKGIEQNENEIEVWEISKERDVSDLLVPIIEYDSQSKWIRMPRLSTSFGLDKYHGPYAKIIYNKLKYNNIYLNEIETCMMGNNPKAFDYGALEAIRPVKNINNL